MDTIARVRRVFYVQGWSVKKIMRDNNNKYSVLATAVGRPVEVHAYAERIVIRQDGVVVGEHARAFGRGQTVYGRKRPVSLLCRA